MKQMEQLLRVRESQLERLEVPAELEKRLHEVLDKRRRKIRPQNSWKLRLVAVIILLSLVGYNFEALAYYGKLLMGYDQVMDGTLSQLNELGKGQVIGKSYSFKNGMTVTLSGVMLDQNQLLVFYTVADGRGNIERINLEPSMFIKGMFSEYRMSSRYGKMNEAKTEIKNIASFEAPRFYEKTLSLVIGQAGSDKGETGAIPFNLDRNKAMGYSLKRDLNQTVNVGKTKINFRSILASPTKTVVEGSIQNIMELAVDQLKGERMRPGRLEINLIANGKIIPKQGGGMSTNIDGITFHEDFDPLPTGTHTLQLELVKFEADYDVNRQIEVRKDEPEKSLQVLGQNIKINKVYEVKGDTYITITTKEGVTLSRVYLLINGDRTDLRETISDQYDKQTDGTINHTRILHFPGTARGLQLNIQRINYPATVNQIISIPLD